jgi:hypothetical protein
MALELTNLLVTGQDNAVATAVEILLLAVAAGGWWDRAAGLPARESVVVDISNHLS